MLPFSTTVIKTPEGLDMEAHKGLKETHKPSPLTMGAFVRNQSLRLPGSTAIKARQRQPGNFRCA
jgi:hypothetical protein